LVVCMNIVFTWCFSWNLRVQAERGEGRRIVFIGVIVR
jgi:hypothetical protein